MVNVKILTKYFGEMEIEEDKIINFPSGLPGFIEETSFILLELPGSPVFQILQSIHNRDIAFVVANPYHFYEDYSFDLDDHLLTSLEINTEEDVMVLSIVTLKDPFSTSTINLKAPIIINHMKKRGKQYILNIDDYSIREPIGKLVGVEG
ncbi:flagellar assembly protein FliW [Ornithinibacillus halophilus]|uniref:Flagellar assembly factor FliW n=1 Tax=Ornithinibacillus halophilus TaxID=930117 RepID=A0A1M5FCE1_9BACI|nr:flagellar assembly protein FliW [Ornithinibacillus halophilus]SHF89204.1 flagellar assembly factor FliW [Ornithinibacillus halophilus]